MIRRLSPRAEFFLVIGIAFGYFVVTSTVALMMKVGELRMTPGRVVRAILTELLILTIIGAILHARGWDWSKLTRPISIGAVVSGVPLFLLTYIFYFAASMVVYSINGSVPRGGMKMIPAAPFWLLAILIVLNSVFEEVTVTGYVVTALSPPGAALSITASTLLRFLYHLYQGPVASIWVLPLGLVYAAVYFQWRNLWPLMTAHTITNLIALSA